MVGLVAGITLMVGTRPAMATAVLAAVTVTVCGLALARRGADPRTDVRPAVAEAAGGVAIAAATLVVVYPQVFAHPLLLMRSAEQSASFRDNADASYFYVPVPPRGRVPAAVAGLLRRRRRVGDPVALPPLANRARAGDAVGARPGAGRGAAGRSGREELRPLQRSPPAPVRVARVGGAGHPGDRDRASWARARGRVRLVSAVALVAVVAPMADQATLFPYQYSYWNVALDATGAHVMSDYWRTSVPRAAA